MKSIMFPDPKAVELTKEQLYRHTVARGTSLKDVDDGTEIVVKEIVSYLNDDDQKVISILDENNKHYVSSSGIFREELAKIVDIFGATGIKLVIRKIVSKSGRTYVTCELG